MHSLIQMGADLLARIGHVGGHLFFDPFSGFSFASLACALLVATLAVSIGRWRRRRRLSLRLLVRALRPRRAVWSASGKTDLGYFFFNTFVGGLLIGWALLSQTQVAAWTHQGLASVAGPSPLHVTGALPALAAGLVLYVVSELGYWVDHWLSHHVPVFWEIHKTHHTAEALSPLTNFRVHPLESLKFYNITAIFTGLAAGVLQYVWGVTQLPVLGADVLFLVFTFTIGHLHHSHIWISFPRSWARVVMSPAAHQVHHSADPRHFGRNLGNALAVWDWLFGTLHAPAASREPLVFGVAGEGPEAHTLTGAFITPMVKAAQVLLRRPTDEAAPVGMLADAAVQPD